MIAATRRYAKRQDTWFRKEPGVAWLTWDGGSLNDLFGRAMLALGPFTQVSR
jgi:tRNA A37 N6-isopentenylltransferase MiaA